MLFWHRPKVIPQEPAQRIPIGEPMASKPACFMVFVLNVGPKQREALKQLKGVLLYVGHTPIWFRVSTPWRLWWLKCCQHQTWLLSCAEIADIRDQPECLLWLPFRSCMCPKGFRGCTLSMAQPRSTCACFKVSVLDPT